MATVKISQGTLQGGECETDSGFKYYEFLGIPYAKPPVGELRFKSAQPPERWEGVRDATKTDSSMISYQVDFRTGEVTGSEDCLYLNVYTPTLPASDNSTLKPVMVISHGGGFISGNGILKNEMGPDYLIEHDVVIVTINYRLGALGFLCLELPEIAGNMGLKDHLQALQWVQSNIDKFGGDKDNVTISGVSAGAAACEFLMLSPRGKGLFHKCILQSGSALNNWAITCPIKTRTMAYKLAQALGFKGEDDELTAMYKVLFAASASDLTNKAFKITQEDTTQRIFFGYVPCIEQDFGNGDALLVKEPPHKKLQDGKFSAIPVLRGFCNKEGILASVAKPDGVKELVEKKQFLEYYRHNFENIDIDKYNLKFKTAYVDNAKPGESPDEFAVNFLGDLNFSAGIYIAAKRQCKKAPVYLYQFCYDGNLNAFKALFGLTREGAAHADDVGYLLRHFALASKIPDENDILMTHRMTTMWTNFVKTGNPTPGNCSEIPVKWPAFTNETQEYLVIDKEFSVQTNWEPEKIAIFGPIAHKYGTYRGGYKCGPAEYDTSWDLHVSDACSFLNNCVIHGDVPPDYYD